MPAPNGISSVRPQRVCNTFDSAAARHSHASLFSGQARVAQPCRTRKSWCIVCSTDTGFHQKRLAAQGRPSTRYADSPPLTVQIRFCFCTWLVHITCQISLDSSKLRRRPEGAAYGVTLAVIAGRHKQMRSCMLLAGCEPAASTRTLLSVHMQERSAVYATRSNITAAVTFISAQSSCQGRDCAVAGL